MRQTLAAAAVLFAGAAFAQESAVPNPIAASAPAAVVNASVKPDRAFKLREQAYAALAKGDKGSARAKLQASLKTDPKNAAAHKQLGFLDYEAGRLTSAAKEFSTAVELDPADLSTSLQLGYTYQKLKKAEQAKEAFNAASQSPDEEVRRAAVAALNAVAGQAEPSL